MIKFIKDLKQNIFDETIDLAKLSKSFLLWGCGVVLVYIGNIYLTRIIGLSAYGEYAVFMNWVALGTTFVSFGWDGYLVKKLPTIMPGGDGKKPVGGIVVNMIVSVIFLSALLAGVTCLYFSFTKKDLPQHGMLTLAFLLIWPTVIVIMIKSFLKVFDIVLFVQILEDLLKPLVLLVVFVIVYLNTDHYRFFNVYKLNVAVWWALAVALLICAFFRLRHKVSMDRIKSVGENWALSCFYFMCIMLGYTFFSKMELLFLGYYNRNEDAGKYQLLLRIADLVILPDFLFNYYLPQKFSHLFAGKEHGNAAKLYKKAARAIFVLQVLCLAGVAVVGYFYLQSFKVESVSMYFLLIILCSSQLFYSLFGSSNLVLMTSGNEKYSFVALAMVLVIEAIANILWIPVFGLQAAVYISWGSVLIYTMILFLFVKHRLKFNSPIIRF